MRPGALRDLQSLRLRQTLDRALALPWYRARFEAAGLSALTAFEVADISRLPFMAKTDFRDHYPFGMLAAPRDEIVRLHASSGTTGKPTIVGYTQDDLDVWGELVARCLSVAGAGSGDILHNAFGYGLFTGGIGIHDGAQCLGVTVVPASGGQTERQTQLILDLKPRLIACTPSYMLTLAEAVERAGVDPRDTSVEIGIHGAEPWSEAMRSAIERRWNIKALDIYGLSEVMGPGVAQERADACGALTIWEDHFFAEVVDPVSGDPLPDGDFGELVLTSLTKEATPVVRYRTGDLTRLREPLAPYPYRRMDRVLGRSDDMIIVRGVNLFPGQIEELILESPQLTPHYEIHVQRDGTMDRLTIVVERASIIAVSDLEIAGPALTHRIKNRLGISAEVTVRDPGALGRSEGKAKRVFDQRDLKAGASPA